MRVSERHVSPYPFTHKIRVKNLFGCQNIHEYLITVLKFKNSDEWKQQICDGFVKLNANLCSPQSLIRSNDIIEHYVSHRIEPPVSCNIEVLRETDNYLAVFKPAPLPVHPCGQYFKNSLIYILEEKGYKPLFATHRLDLQTSGIVLFAKTTEFATAVQGLFQAGEIKKEYLAVVDGNFPDHVEVTKPIQRKKAYLFECHENGIHAQTVFEKIKYFENFNLSLVRCTPLTGRTHQIRLHLREIGYPIYNDVFYNPKFVERVLYKKHKEKPIALVAIKLSSKLFDLNLHPKFFTHFQDFK